ncbi:MAG: response regulator [Chloroflexi bacterium]|nr:MAG: response regulator [Chloroflexota bacterium]
MNKILLVEDNEMLQEILAERLCLRNFDVVIANNGQLAVELVQKESPDLILMDMSLPVMDGWEATRRIKSNPETAHIPIIALTAHALSGDREKALEAGCDDYETKPVNFPQLLEKIKQYLLDHQ